MKSVHSLEKKEAACNLAASYSASTHTQLLQILGAMTKAAASNSSTVLQPRKPPAPTYSRFSRQARMLHAIGKQGAALSLVAAMAPSAAAAAAAAVGASWRRQLLQTTRAASTSTSTSTTNSSPGPLPGVEPQTAAADKAQGRVDEQAPQANQHLPDPAAPDAPISLLQRISEAAQVLALPTMPPAACCWGKSADVDNAVASTPAHEPA
jgi:hypothetical protein